MGMPQGMQAGALGQLQAPAQQRHLGTYRIRLERIAARVCEDQIELAVVDRKSTRLYSSHRCISYSGFCFKKKENYTSTPTTVTSAATDCAPKSAIAAV